MNPSTPRWVDEDVSKELSEGLDDLSDIMTGQDPDKLLPLCPKYRDLHVDPERNTRVTFSNLVLQLTDPLDARIIEVLDVMNTLNKEPSPSIRKYYSKLHALIKDDFWQVNKMLSIAALNSFQALKGHIEIAIQTYQIALAKEVGTKLSDISSMRDDMMARAVEYREQEANAREFQEDMVETWGKLTRAMTSYIEELEKKTLETSTPRSRGLGHLHTMPKNTASSSTSRVQSVSLSMTLGSVYRGEMGRLTVLTSRKILFKPSSALYKPLQVLCDFEVGPVAWETLLNKDIKELNALLSRETTCLSGLMKMNNVDKASCFNDILDRLPDRSGQWTLVEE